MLNGLGKGQEVCHASLRAELSVFGGQRCGWKSVACEIGLEVGGNSFT
jgi:hypothetical protein